MKICNICPRKCNVDREQTLGVCGAGNHIYIRKAMLHQFEEPVLTTQKDKGSGTIFFSGCNLKCVYCQNYDVSHTISGERLTPSDLATLFKKLENAGAGNIDLVTPTHFTRQIIEALKIYKPHVPVIWNSGGYESIETLKQLNGLVDIYLVDFKYADNALALKYSKAPNYLESVLSSISEMKKQQPHNVFKKGKLVKGIIVRHLVLPSLTKDSLRVLDHIYTLLGHEAIVSIMSQFVPMGECDNYPEINRRITNLEYKTVIAHAKKLSLQNAFIQDLDSANCSYTPIFDKNIIDI